MFCGVQVLDSADILKRLHLLTILAILFGPWWTFHWTDSVLLATVTSR